MIDLTRDDDPELMRALRESLESSNATSFGPSNRAPDPNWAMVPSNVRDVFISICGGRAALNAETGMCGVVR